MIKYIFEDLLQTFGAGKQNDVFFITLHDTLIQISLEMR